MRLQNDLIPPHAAPAAGMPLSRFHKVNWALVLRAPGTFYDPVARLVHLNETARRKDGIHCEILRPEVAVGEIGRRKLRQIGEGDQSPLLDHAAQIRSAALIKAR